MASIKNLVKFAAKFFEMGKSKKTVKAKSIAKTKSKPATKKNTKKASPPKAKKAIKKSKPAAKKVVKPAAKKSVKKTTKPLAKKKATKNVAKSSAKKLVSPQKPKLVVVKKQTSAKPPVKQKPAKPEKPAAAKPNVQSTAKPAAPLSEKTKLPFQENISSTVTDNTPQMRYSDDDLKEFKELIENKLAAAREELKNLKEALDNHTESQVGNKAWNMEEGSDTTEMEYLMNQISRQHQYIRNLEMALVRIENKTYGICRVTGKLIPKERLRVVPHATMSLEAKMKRKAEEESPAAIAPAPPVDFSEGFED